MTAVLPTKSIEERKTSKFVFWGRARIYVLFLTLTCITFMLMNTMTFTFTIICMDDIVEDHHRIWNNTDTHWFERPREKSMLISGAAIGGLISLFPAVPLISSIGLRKVQTISGFISACGTLLFPFAVSNGFYTSFLCRVIQGMGSSVMFTTVGVMPGVWAPSSEVNTFMAILSCSFQLSSIICMPVSGLLCESALGWRSIYYLFGSITLVMFILFWFTYTDDPEAHRNVSGSELSKIKTGKPPTITKRELVPYRKMISDPTVLISCISYFGGNMGFFVLCLYGPTYLREVLKFDVKETGFLTALPFILAAITKFSAGQVSDRLTFLSEKARFVFFAAVSQFGLAAGLAVMALTSSRFIAQIAFNFSIICSSLNIMGVIKCVQLRCLQHVHFPLAAIAVGAYFIQFLAPIIVSFICPDNTSEQWTVFFLFISVVCVVCNLGFPIFTRSEAADYTKKSEKAESSDEKA